MTICILGGGGVRTVIFINGLLKRCKTLHIHEVVLYDTDHEKLEIIGKLCQYVVRREHGDLLVRYVTDPVEAIRGADYIVTTLRVGGDHARVMDERLALRRGVIGQETTGVGGFSMAVRTIPVLLDYMKLVKAHAKQALVFNFTNPSGLVTQALHSAGYDLVIGICDAPSSMKYRMARYLSVPEDDLYTEFFGLNHLSWIKKVEIRNPDGTWEEISRKLLMDDNFLQGIQELEVFDPAVLRETGLLPNEYLFYYYHRERALENMLSAPKLRGETIEAVNREMFAALKGMDPEQEPEEMLQTFLFGMQMRENSYMSVESGGSVRPLLARGTLPIPEGMGYAGVMLDCIEGLQQDEARFITLSVKNNGSLPCLRDDDVVEMTCSVSRKGIVPVPQSDIPEFCETYIRLIKRYERLTVEAIRENSALLARNALALHPLINSWSLAGQLLSDYREVYGNAIPGGAAR
ncbi:MAG: glycoside hydrolase [Clostridia bacterium]|nr:glycoside hydrolase [Clostridia bacterium]